MTRTDRSDLSLDRSPPTLDRYGQLFEGEHDRLAERLDSAYRQFAAS